MYIQISQHFKEAKILETNTVITKNNGNFVMKYKCVDGVEDISFPNRQLEQYQKEIKLQTVLETHTQTMVG